MGLGAVTGKDSVHYQSALALNAKIFIKCKVIINQAILYVVLLHVFLHMHTHPFFMDHFPCVMKLCIDGILKSMVCVVNCSLSNEDNSHWYFVVFFSIVKVFFPCSHYYYGTFFYSHCKSHFFPIYLFFGKLGRVQGNNGGRGRKLVGFVGGLVCSNRH